MRKEFNITGLCVPKKHYMVNPDNRLEKMKKMVDKENYFVINRARQYGKTTTLAALVLMIDEADSAMDNQVFLDFLSQLRNYYLQRDRKGTITFHSVILAGVYDIKNLKGKLRNEEERRMNSPWNIAVNFDMDMSFSKDEIAGMLKEYEKDVNTGMDTEMSSLWRNGYWFWKRIPCSIL